MFAAGGPLEDVAGIDLVCVPDAAAPPDGAPDATLRDAQAAVLAHCESMGDRFAILDAAPGPGGRPGQAGDGDATADDAARLDAVVAQSQWRRSRFGALYFPWLWVAGAGAAVPPCGHVAGLYARTDARTGVHKAPANETLHGVAALDLALGRAAHGRLNDAGVNCILGSTAWGLRVWGARTLSGQPDWRHVPVSRLFAALAGWLRHGTEDLVFEPHTPELWRRVRRRLGAYCLDLMHAGAHAGRDPEGAFFVRCDAENNPPGDRDAGRLVADVGLAPTTPAEFVVVRITQGAGGFAMTGGG
jgi:phage tail sheath protein FI